MASLSLKAGRAGAGDRARRSAEGSPENRLRETPAGSPGERRQRQEWVRLGKRGAENTAGQKQARDGGWRGSQDRGSAGLASAFCQVEAHLFLAWNHPLPVLAQPCPRQLSSLRGGPNLGTFGHLILSLVP